MEEEQVSRKSSDEEGWVALSPMLSTSMITKA
jgi:hypothetical protein